MTAITPQILLRAYAAGVFPMAESADDPALYWIEPDERGVLPLEAFHVSHSLRKSVRHKKFDIRINMAFGEVIRACAEKRPGRKDTWINGRIISLYTQLHKINCAHSVEAWRHGKLVGGLYGVKIGSAFFGESMFSREADASKVCLVHLVARLRFGGFALLDAQFVNSHLTQFGAIAVRKAEYHKLLEPALAGEADFGAFSMDQDVEKVLDLAMS